MVDYEGGWSWLYFSKATTGVNFGREISNRQKHEQVWMKHDGDPVVVPWRCFNHGRKFKVRVRYISDPHRVCLVRLVAVESMDIGW